ncbi:MAG: SAM-dependent methyltransferase, partial [Flavobacteriales bacterium]
MENNNFDVWEDIFQRKEWGKYPSIPLIKFVARNFYSSPDRSEVKLLEIGSGPGANLWYMAREGFTVYGIEGSQTACNNATKRLNNEGLGDRIGKIIAGDYHEKLNDFEDGYFDAIIDVESLYCNVWDKSKEIVKLAFDKL